MSINPIQIFEFVYLCRSNAAIQLAGVELVNRSRARREMSTGKIPLNPYLHSVDIKLHYTA